MKVFYLLLMSICYPIAQLLLFSADGESTIFPQKLIQITNDAASESYPSWSPGGDELLFIWKGSIWRQSLKEYRSRQVSSHLGRYQDPSVSPNGQWIVATSNRGGCYQIWLISERKELALPLEEVWWRGRPVWSPDNKMIAYSSYRSGYSEIWLVNKDGSKQKQITYLKADSKFPCWSPDGSSIAFSSDKAGSKDIWLVSLN